MTDLQWIALVLAFVTLSAACALYAGRWLARRRKADEQAAELRYVAKCFLRRSINGRPNTRAAWREAAVKARRAGKLSVETFQMIMREPPR